MAADNFLWFPTAATGGLIQANNANKPLGETTDDWFKAKNALEVRNINFGVSQSETTGSGTSGAGAGKAVFREIEIRKDVDLASVPLYVACAAGAHFPTVMLAVRKAGGSPLLYLQYCFRMVFVININWSGGGGETAPEETIKFKFGAMGMQYIKQKPDGSEDTKMQGLWSTAANFPSLNVPGLPAPPSPLFMDGTQS
jgi:type VI secretion system secreted protein Hcp